MRLRSIIITSICALGLAAVALTVCYQNSILWQARVNTFLSLGPIIKDVSPKTTERFAQMYKWIWGSRESQDLVLASLHLYTGNLDEAEEAFKLALKKQRPPKELEYAKYHLGYTYLRQAEVNNCMGHSEGEFCLYPVSKKGIHSKKHWAQQANQVFSELHAKHPNKYLYLWLKDFSLALVKGSPEKVFSKATNQLIFKEQAFKRGIYENHIVGDAVIEDFDHDGDEDIVFSTLDAYRGLTYYQNDGSGHFSKATTAAKLDQIAGGMNLNYTDINSDGFFDLSISRGGWTPNSKVPSSLALNNGKAQFEDVTLESNLYINAPTQTFTWADFNNDGHLDVFVGLESYRKNPSLFAAILLPHQKPESRQLASRLFINNGKGHFADVTQASNIHLEEIVLGAVWLDYNNDHYQDLYVSVFSGPNRLYKNLGPEHAWQFEDVSETAHIQKPHFSFPVMTADFNNDGLEDLAAFSNDVKIDLAAKYFYTNSYEGEHSVIYINQGDGTFKELPRQKGTHHGFLAMGLGYGDFDCNGYMDIYIGTGTTVLGSNFPNQLLLNQGGQSFVEVAGSARVGNVQKGHGVVVTDIDGNGSEDIFHMLGGIAYGDSFFSALYMNQRVCKNWIAIKLQGVQSNKLAIGAKIELSGVNHKAKNFSIYRTVNFGSSFGSTPLTQRISLEAFKKLNEIRVHWPQTGKTQIVKNFKTNQLNTINENYENNL